jgi:Flp pilus assembly pilin Flp
MRTMAAVVALAISTIALSSASTPSFASRMNGKCCLSSDGGRSNLYRYYIGRRAIPHTCSAYAASCIRDSRHRADAVQLCQAARAQCLRTGVHVGPTAAGNTPGCKKGSDQQAVSAGMHITGGVPRMQREPRRSSRRGRRTDFSSIRINLGFRIYSPLGRHRYTLRALKTNNNQEVELKRTVLSFLSDESGATAIEYGLIAAGISLAIIAIVNGLGSNLNTKFTEINSSLK